MYFLLRAALGSELFIHKITLYLSIIVIGYEIVYMVTSVPAFIAMYTGVIRV